MKYYILSDLIKNGLDITPYIDEILRMTIVAKQAYPEYTKWFIEKHVPGIYEGTRDTIIVLDNNLLVGVANIKKEPEKKLCTLYFRPEYRYKKAGRILVDRAIELLENNHPLITIPSTSIKEFKNIIKRYKWELTDCIDDCYSKGVSEFIFNGEIALPNKDLSNEERIILTYKHTKNKNILKLIPFGYIKYIIYYKINPKKIIKYS